jgi:hypothetical protein
MYRSTHPFRWATARSTRSVRPSRPRVAVDLDLATWHDRLSPANRPASLQGENEPAEALEAGARPLPLARPVRVAA